MKLFKENAAGHKLQAPVFTLLLFSAALLAPEVLQAQSMPTGGTPPQGGMPPQGKMGGKRMPKPPKPIRLAEFEQSVEAVFENSDIDRDGFITLEEMRGQLDAIRNEAIRKRFAEIDENGDEQIGYQEFYFWQTAMGSRVQSDEAAAAISNGMIPAFIPVNLGRGERDRVLARLVTPLSAIVITNANVNYDQGMSLEEFQAFQRRKFDTLDENKDGFLVMTEMQTPKSTSGNRRQPQSPQ